MTQREFDAEVSAEIRSRIARADAEIEREQCKEYPSLPEIEAAGIDMLQRWHRSLPTAQGSSDVLVIVEIRNRIRKLGGKP